METYIPLESKSNTQDRSRHTPAGGEINSPRELTHSSKPAASEHLQLLAARRLGARRACQWSALTTRGLQPSCDEKGKVQHVWNNP